MFNLNSEILKSNSRRWNFEELSVIIEETENRFNDVVVKSDQKDYQSLLTDFFGKAVLYTKEALTLLYQGYADGAISLSKELFETSVLLSFFEQHKDEEDIFERYFDNIELSSISDSMLLLSFLKDGATDDATKTSLSDMTERKKRTYSGLKTKYKDFLIDGSFRPYWYLGNVLEDKSFYGIMKNTAWDKTVFKHIYNMTKHSGHNAVNPSDSDDVAAVMTNPSTEGFQIPVCFTVTSFINISKIVFANDGIDFSDIENRLNGIIKPLFSEIWK